jgi:hypothetical protein
MHSHLLITVEEIYVGRIVAHPVEAIRLISKIRNINGF